MRWGFAGMLVLVGAAVAAGCGGSASKPSASPTSEVTAVGHADALTRSSENVLDARSFSATFRATVHTDQKTVEEDGEMAYHSPTFYMKIAIQGQQMEILAAPPEEYISLPGEGWYSLGDALFNKEAFAQWAKNRGPIDYARTVGALQDTNRLPDEQIDGKLYAHYSGTFDLKKLIASIPQDVLKPGVASVINQLNQAPAKLEVWIDMSSGLPRRTSESLTTTANNVAATADITVDYTSWGGSVDIPPAPTDAKPLSDLTGGLSLDEIAYLQQFSRWLRAVGGHVQAVDGTPDVFHAALTDDQRSTFNKAWAEFRGDVGTLNAMAPPDRFKVSYYRFRRAMESMEPAIDAMEYEVTHPGQGNEQKARSGMNSGAQAFTDAVAQFKSEFSASAPDGSPTPSTSP